MASIPKQEYFDRIAKLQANMKKAGLDACLVHGTESDFANVRYLTEYWPTFEQAGVFVPAEGEAILLIGPESLKYAQGRSVVPNIMQLLVYRESAEPDYPGIPLATFADVAKKGMGIDFDEETAKTILEQGEVVITVDLGAGQASATAYGCDLSYEYVKINGSYRS